MARKPGTKNRAPQDRIGNLMEFVASIKTETTPCINCGTVPLKGVVVPGLYDYVRRSDATLKELTEKINREGFWCRSCLLQRARRQAPGTVQTKPLKAPRPGTLVTIVSEPEAQAGALSDLDARLSELGKQFPGP